MEIPNNGFIPFRNMSESTKISIQTLHPQLIATSNMEYQTQEEKITQARSEIHNAYKMINAIIGNYVEMPENNKKFIATWLVGTYFHEEFNTYPFLFFNAMRGSAKTRTLKLISAMGAKGDGSVQNNLTEAVLFRIPRGTTTCIDEVEQIGSKEKQTLRELLNSSYKKGMKVKRMKKKKVNGNEEQIVETFEPYFPIAMANIWGMDEVLADRSVTLILEKSDNPFVTKKVEDFDTNPYIQDIKRTLTQFSVVSVVSLREKTYIQHWNDYINHKYNNINNITTQTTYNNNIAEEEPIIDDLELLELFNKIDETGINGRNFELLFPILITAKIIDEEVFEDILKIGVQLTETKKQDEYAESKDVSLYEFVDSMVSFGNSFIAIKEITQRFREFIGESNDEDKWLNDKWMGRALKRLNLAKDRRREANGRYVILDYCKAHEKLKIFKKCKEDKDATL